MRTMTFPFVVAGLSEIIEASFSWGEQAKQRTSIKSNEYLMICFARQSRNIVVRYWERVLRLQLSMKKDSFWFIDSNARRGLVIMRSFEGNTSPWTDHRYLSRRPSIHSRRDSNELWARKSHRYGESSVQEDLQRQTYRTSGAPLALVFGGFFNCLGTDGVARGP